MGSGPGGHPGVTIVKLTSDLDSTTQAIETALELEGDRKFLFKYQTEDGKEYAVFASKY